MVQARFLKEANSALGLRLHSSGKGFRYGLPLIAMGFAKDDAEGVLVILVLAAVFGGFFAFVLRLFVIGIIIAISIIFIAFILQSIQALIKERGSQSPPRRQGR
jgi:hypothetical protein